MNRADVTATNPSPGSELGARLRQLRQGKGFTLKQLAAVVGVSESFVSQVERGKANPSVTILTRMAEALGASMTALFSVAAEPASSVVRASERRRMTRRDGTDEDYLLTPPSARTMLIIQSVFGAGQTSGDQPYAHRADEECLIIVSGQLDVRVGSVLHHLGTGDSLLLDPKIPHGYANPGPGPTTALWVTCPPVY
jgi:transcriptional regulator with XRE-family HTH domain